MAGGVALAVTFALFLGMQTLVAIGRAAVGDTTTTRVIEFVRLKRNSNLELKERRLPDRSKPKPQPRSPTLEVSQNASTTNVMPMDVPAPAIDNNFKLHGGLNLGTAPSDRDIVPVVRVRPMYPQRAAQRRIQGWVEVEFQISKTGSVKNARVLKAQPSGVFDRAALRAIRKWKYKPQIENGVPVEAHGVTVRLKFELGDEE